MKKSHKCKICGDKTIAWDYCSLHYQRMKFNIDMWKEKQIHDSNRKCMQCGKKYYCKDLCSKCYRLKPRLDLMGIIGGQRCVRCGFDDIRALQVEHKNGGGRKEARNFINQYEMYKFYVNNPEKAKEKLQVMCANCNWIKKYQNSEN